MKKNNWSVHPQSYLGTKLYNGLSPMRGEKERRKFPFEIVVVVVVELNDYKEEGREIIKS